MYIKAFDKGKEVEVFNCHICQDIRFLFDIDEHCNTLIYRCYCYQDDFLEKRIDEIKLDYDNAKTKIEKMSLKDTVNVIKKVIMNIQTYEAYSGNSKEQMERIINSLDKKKYVRGHLDFFIEKRYKKLIELRGETDLTVLNHYDEKKGLELLLRPIKREITKIEKRIKEKEGDINENKN